MSGVDVGLRCGCGQVQGRIRAVAPGGGNRLVCYCDSCQAFARHLGRDGVMDAWGGTEIFQYTPSHVEITQGADQLRCLRLTPKGLHRWYTACCRTPAGNTMGPGWPFVGLSVVFLESEDRDAILGPMAGYSWTKTAADGLPQAHRDQALGPLSLVRVLTRMLRWRIAGRHRPSPYFDTDGRPVSQPEVLEG